MRTLADTFRLVMTDRRETLTYDSEDPYYQYLQDLLTEEEVPQSKAESRLILKAKLDQALRRFMKEVRNLVYNRLRLLLETRSMILHRCLIAWLRWTIIWPP